MNTLSNEVINFQCVYSNSVLKECIFHASVYPDMLKLQKTIYVSYGIYLREGGSIDTRLNFQARRHGPILPYIWYRYETYKNKIIREYLKIDTEQTLVDDYTTAIARAVKVFGDMSMYQLTDYIHDENSAWKNAYCARENTLIDHTLIREEFADKDQRWWNSFISE